MSKPVRIREDVAAQVEVRAAAETRSFANMVEVLLLSALGSRMTVEHVVSPIAPRAPEPESVPPVAHDVPMRQQARNLALRDGKCSADVARGTKCKLCGKVHR